MLVPQLVRQAGEDILAALGQDCPFDLQVVLNMTVGSRELVHQNCEAKALYERVEAEEATTFILTHGGNRKRHFTFEPSHALLAAEHAQSAVSIA